MKRGAQQDRWKQLAPDARQRGRRHTVGKPQQIPTGTVRHLPTFKKTIGSLTPFYFLSGNRLGQQLPGTWDHACSPAPQGGRAGPGSQDPSEGTRTHGAGADGPRGGWGGGGALDGCRCAASRAFRRPPGAGEPTACLSPPGWRLTRLTPVCVSPSDGLGFHPWRIFAKHLPRNPTLACNLSIIWAWERPSHPPGDRFKRPRREMRLSYLEES